MIEWLLAGGVAVWGIRKMGKPKKEAAKRTSAPCIIEYRSRYWNGDKFVKDKSAAKRFPDDAAAWDFVDDHLPDDIGEDCSLEFTKA